MADQIKLLEKKITGKMGAIKRGERKIKETNIGLDFKMLHELDPVLHANLVKKYKNIVLKK